MPKSKGKDKSLIVGDTVDRISKLPDELLCRILTYLQTKEVVATSILSKRWEHVWTTTHNLDCSDQLQFCKDYEAELRMFIEYVDNVIFYHGGSKIEKCSLSCYSQDVSAHLYAWICAIVCSGVQEFTLQSTSFTDLPWSVLTCKTLVVLKIKGRFVLNLPSGFCLPNLKALHLESVIYVDNTYVEMLCLGCPFLEELDIERNDWDGMQNLSISVPLLKRLSICLSGFYLEGAHVFCKCENEILQGLQNVRLLALSGDTITSLSNFIRDHDLPKFKHLLRLELGTAANIDWSLLPRLLENTNNLEVLVFPKGLVVHKNHREFQHFSWLPPESVPDCLIFQLKIVQIRHFVGALGEVDLVKYLLESSKVLERMAIHCHDFNSKERKINCRLEFARNLISNVHRGSETCEVEIV
ncbi:hypothetical protein ACFE04_021433 [Oxalis oulophora]